MRRASLEPVVRRLAAWRTETVGRLKNGDRSSLPLKLALDAAIRWLEVCERFQIESVEEVVELPPPEWSGEWGEYRVLWDAETEDRDLWREVAQAVPGDLVVKRRSPPPSHGDPANPTG